MRGFTTFRRLVRKGLARKVSSEERFERSKRISQGDKRGWGEEPARKTEVSPRVEVASYIIGTAKRLGQS